MVQQQVDVLDTTVQKTYTWLREIMEEAGWNDRHKAYLALRAVLHALRDRLAVDEAAHLSAQLPMLVRGIYYESWRPAESPKKIRRPEEFLNEIANNFPGPKDASAALPMARAVFRVLERNVSSGEINQVIEDLPLEVRSVLREQEV